VAPGDQLTHKFPLKEFKEAGYHLRVYGPNRFYREYKGDAQDPAIKITCDYEQEDRDPSQLTGNLKINFNNSTGKNVKVRIADQAYGMGTVELIVEPGKQSTVIDLSKNYNLYDLTVTLDGHKAFAQHFAGRVETGKDGKTDPQMG